MIVLDTNVLSAMMRRAEEPSVERWLDEQPIPSVWTTTVTVFEIRFGIELLPPSRRRDLLDAAFARAVDEVLDGRVLPFDRLAAQAAGTIAARRQRKGRPVEIRDVQIAGIALARKATLATRNIRHFTDLDVPVIDPWSG